MQIVRTIVWVLLLVALVIFSAFNWTPVEVKIWENLIVETKIPALVLVAFLIGLAPMWLLHRAQKWQLKRRIASLEAAARAAAETLAPSIPAPAEPETPVAPMAEPAPEPVSEPPPEDRKPLVP